MNQDEEGSAAVEFLTIGVLLLVPLVYLVLTLGALQGAAFAANGAARQAARVMALAPTEEAGRAAAAASIRTALDDWKVAAGASSVDIACAPEPGRCRTPRGTVTVSVRVAVALPLLPPALHLGGPGTVAMAGTAVQPVSEFTPLAEASG